MLKRSEPSVHLLRMELVAGRQVRRTHGPGPLIKGVQNIHEESYGGPAGEGGEPALQGLPQSRLALKPVPVVKDVGQLCSE